MTLGSTLHRELGLTDDELAAIQERLERDPTFTELAMFSVMWSEHCSYKSSRRHLADLPTQGEHVVVGPGEGAGVVEVAPGVMVAWKIESHNHPSFVEPVNGAATGVGGIVRDILSMGARPIALMDSLRFGLPGRGRTDYLVEGVVDGISSYGNAIGVPTVGGESIFDDCYTHNPLVNVACLGVVEHALQHGRAEGPGNALVLIGSSTGRDGIGGASVLASAGFDAEAADKRPSVQVGDPFAEKLVIEACLELIQADLLTGFQDLGAGGICCPASEMTSKAGTGAVVDVDRVTRREPGMAPFEVMISESQERMLAVVEPSKLDAVLAVCRRWELGAEVIGEVTATGRLQVVSGGEVVADIPSTALTDDAPSLDRPRERPDFSDELGPAAALEPPVNLEATFLAMLSQPDIASKRWVWEQYDHMIGLGTLQGPGADAAVIRLPDSAVAVAITVDGPGRYCRLDPYEGACLAVAEAARNVACTGARPVAVTNCLNFGSPEEPELMWSFAEAVRGIGDACSALGAPVTGGNVSFYNETEGRPIHPTPVIGMLGVLASVEAQVGIGFRAEGDAILLLGNTDELDFGGSDLAALGGGAPSGRPPRLDLAAERNLHLLLGRACAEYILRSAHDLSSGGLAVALAEAAFAGRVGFNVELPPGEAWRVLFSETPSRAVVSCPRPDVARLTLAARDHEVPIRLLGEVGGEDLEFGAFGVSLERALSRWDSAFVESLSSKLV
ncbi:MAG: phosphoribosylformylglycinamidine synthase subunit PurL [Actinomycetota bacterium]|nr:phosphoribosylformylglycinamidine synthase subunit PurL [Actinomycetota bacterium]